MWIKYSLKKCKTKKQWRKGNELKNKCTTDLAHTLSHFCLKFYIKKTYFLDACEKDAHCNDGEYCCTTKVCKELPACERSKDCPDNLICNKNNLCQRPETYGSDYVNYNWS